MPTIGVFLLFQTNTYFAFTVPDLAKDLAYSTLLFNTAIVPTIMTWLLMRKGGVNSLHLKERSERWLPFAYSAFLTFFTYYLFHSMNFPLAVNRFVLGSALTVFLLMMANIKWKLSIHTAGIGGVCAALFAVFSFHYQSSLLLLIGAFIVSGLIVFARLASGAHNNFEVYGGYLLGFFAVYFTMVF